MKSTRCPRFPWRVIAACGLAAVVTLTASGATAGPASARTERRPIVAASGENTDSKPSFGSLPICFEPNVGQASAGVKFLTRGSNASLTATGAVLEGGGQPVTLEFVGASGTARASGITELPGRSNYLIGNDASKWRTNVPTYASIRIGQLYPGVDLVWYGKGRSLEYDLVVASGADPNSIAFELEGFPSPELEADGALVAGDVRLERPFAYQEIDGARQAVASRFVPEPGAFSEPYFDRRSDDPRQLAILERSRLRAGSQPTVVRQTVRPRLADHLRLGQEQPPAGTARRDRRRHPGEIRRGVRADHGEGIRLARSWHVLLPTLPASPSVNWGIARLAVERRGA